VTRKTKIGNVAINDVLPPRAARCDATANLKCFVGPGHHRPNFDGFIYIRRCTTLFGSHQRHLPPPIWQTVVFRLLCAMPENEAKRRIYGGCVKTPVQF